jgi:hypothetical protein
MENIQGNKLKGGKRLYIDLSFGLTDLTYQIERRGLMKEKLFFVPLSSYFVKVWWSETRCDVLIASILCCAAPPPGAVR